MSDQTKYLNIDDEFAKTQECLLKCSDHLKAFQLEAKECIQVILAGDRQCSETQKVLDNLLKRQKSENVPLLSKLEHDHRQSEDLLKVRQGDLKTFNESLVQKRKVLEEQRLGFKSLTDEIDKLTSRFRLYNCITHTSLDSGAEDNIYKGYVSKKGEVKTFSLNRNESSAFFITNNLWDLISDS